MVFKDNPEFTVAFEHAGIIFYMPAVLTEYHKSRELAMQAQEQFSRCGISPEVLTAFADKLLEFANKQNNTDTLKTDVGLIANNIKARMKTPFDEMCAMRMGAIACFMEGENPSQVSDNWTSKKLALANEYPAIADFFLDMGIAFTPEYAAQWRGLQAEDYFQKRKLMLDGLTSQPIRQT